MNTLFSSPADVAAFIGELRTEIIGRKIEYLTETTSTNDRAALAAKQGAVHGHLFIAERQTQGRGRHGRVWEAPAGQGLLFSVIFRPTAIEPASLGWVPLVAGLACAEGLEAANVSPDLLQRKTLLATKWPNDIVIPGGDPPGWKKMGGILCESVLSHVSLQDYIIIGIGLNINQRLADLPSVAKAPPVSLRIYKGREFERRKVLRCVLEALEARLSELSGNEAASLKDRISRSLASWWTPERTLRVELPREKMIEGRYDGLDEYGRLKLVQADGSVVQIVDGEIVEVF